MEAQMRKLLGVALVSACIAAGSTFWAKSNVFATAVAADPTGVRLSPHEIMKSSTDLPVETVVDLN
jgi:hypothetical protein